MKKELKLLGGCVALIALICAITRFALPNDNQHVTAWVIELFWACHLTIYALMKLSDKLYENRFTEPKEVVKNGQLTLLIMSVFIMTIASMMAIGYEHCSDRMQPVVNVLIFMVEFFGVLIGIWFLIVLTGCLIDYVTEQMVQKKEKKHE
jgi:hypothetical protein